MRKGLLIRGLLGIPVGISIGYFITILFSFIWGQGNYFSVNPMLAETFGSEINGVAVQFVFYGLIGSLWAASTVVWNIERWSLLKQTFVHFILALIIEFPISYLLGWVEKTILGVITFASIFYNLCHNLVFNLCHM